MAKQIANFRQGDTKVIKIINATQAFSMVGMTYWFTLRSKFEDDDFVAQVKTFAGDHPNDDIVNNIKFIEMSSDITKDIPVGNYFWDIQRSDGSTPPKIKTILPTEKLLKDKIKVLPQATKEHS